MGFIFRVPAAPTFIPTGYFGGGLATDVTSEIDGIQFDTESAINPTATLSVARHLLAGVNSSSRGYFGGGSSTAGATPVVAEIDGIQFSDESSINPTATLTIPRTFLAAVNSSTRGYFGGGFIGTNP